MSRSALPAAVRDNRVVTAPIRNLAALVDTRTWTSSGGNTFPGADVPFGMVQWSPDTVPHRSDGGGYTYGDHRLTGYSLTHVSGPGCRAAGDIPILPLTGKLPATDPNAVTTSFTNAGEVAQAGYYSATSNGPHPIVSQFTATPHTAMGKFTFPRTPAADFLIKLADSERQDLTPHATIVGHREVAGSVTSGDFCDESQGYGPQLYTVYFDLVFNRPFTSARVTRAPGQHSPDAVLLTFNTTRYRVVKAHVAISYVRVGNARLDVRREAPGWNFAAYRAKAQRQWNQLLGRIGVSGGSYARTQEFYSLLYKDFLQPNLISDVNGQYLGSDQHVHTLARGQSGQYGMFSGWDIYHSAAQLQAMLDPAAASDLAQSLVNYYRQNGILPQWAYLSLDNYVMVGDPADSLIADYYAFGARHFDKARALADMLAQAGRINPIRPGAAIQLKIGYLPENSRYGCCNLRGSVASLLEYDTADFALSRYAAALGRWSAAIRFRRKANDWVNVFDRATGLLTPRLRNGSFVMGVGPVSRAGYVEGDAEEYLWDVPNNYAGLFARLGGRVKAAQALARYLSQPSGRGRHAYLGNEFDLGEQFAPDYAGDPAATQLAVRNARTRLYRPGPDGLADNDDLGGESSQFIWDMLGLYPENPGSGTLVLGSPGFPEAVIDLPNGRSITMNAPGASAHQFYVASLTVNGQPDRKLYLSFDRLAAGATLTWTLSSSATTWGDAPADAPPSYPDPR